MTTLTTDPEAMLDRQLNRLRLTLVLARNVAMLATAAAVAAATVLLLAVVDTWLIPLPHGWGGGGVLLLSAVAPWMVERGLMPSDARPSRLSICLRLEQAVPAIGERLSRAIGLTPSSAPPAECEPRTKALQQNLRQAALADAASALHAIPLTPWLRTQPELRAAAFSAAAACLAWGALSVSWAAGSGAWRTSLAMPFREQPAASISAPPTAMFPVADLSLEQATLAVYRQTVAEHDSWRERASSTRDMAVDAERLTELAEAARMQAERHRSDGDAEALVLTALAGGLQRAAASATTGEPPSRIRSQLGDLILIAQAAAGLAEAAAAVHDASLVVATAAPSSAGLAGDELAADERAWRAMISRDLSLIAAGLTADQNLLISRDVLPATQRPEALGRATTAAVEQNQLFSAASDLSEAASSLDATVMALGMPLLAELPARSVAAAARRRLASIDPTRRIDRVIPRDGGRQSPSGQPGGTPAAPAVAVAIADDLPPGEQPTPRPATREQTAAAGGQPGAGGGIASPPSAEPSATRGRSTAGTSVWIPQLPAAELTVPQAPPAEREPAASPGYFRRLLMQTTQTADGLQRACVSMTAAVFVTVAIAAAEESPSAEENPPAATPPDAGEASAAVDRGVQWLIASQHPDGSWGSQRFRGSVAVTAHGLLALASTGSTGLAGPHAPAVERALSFLLEQAGNDGLIAGNEAAANGPMYGHAYAIQALAELSGEAARPDVMATLRRGCRLIEQTQNDEGGWRYQPRQADADVSVSAAVLVALEAATAAGIEVSEETVERAAAYLLALQNTDGGFRYQTAPGPSGPARTAAALVALALTRPDQRDALASGRRWLQEHPLIADPADGYAAYGVLASSTAAWQAGPEAWAHWYRASAPSLLAAQHTDGSWPDPSCAEYGTAAAILSLTTANGLLPAWKRGTTP